MRLHGSGGNKVFHFVGRASTILVILPFNTAFLWEASCQAVRVKGPLFQVTWIRDNKTDGEARYRVQVFGKDARTFDIRISLKAKYQAKPSPEEKIEEWFKCNPLAGSGVSMKIPDDHFCTRDN